MIKTKKFGYGKNYMDFEDLISAGDYDKIHALMTLLKSNKVKPADIIDGCDKDGKSLLHKVVEAYEKHPEESVLIAKELVANGIDINSQDYRHNAPIHEAIKKRAVKLVEFFIASGADLSLQGESGKLPLRLVQDLKARTTDESIANDKIALMIKSGNISQNLYEYEWTKKHEKLKRYLLDGDEYEFQDMLEECLDDSLFSINAQDEYGNALLHYAMASRSALELSIGLIIKNGGNVNIRNYTDCTPLFEGARARNFNNVKTLLKYKDVNPNIMENKKGYTSVHMLAEKFGIDRYMAKALKAHDADFDARNFRNSTPLMLASGVDLGEDEDYKSFAKDVVAETIHNLVDNGADVLARDDEGNAPIHYSAYHCYKAVVESLIEEGASIRAANNAGETAFSMPKSPDAEKEAIALLKVKRSASFDAPQV